MRNNTNHPQIKTEKLHHVSERGWSVKIPSWSGPNASLHFFFLQIVGSVLAHANQFQGTPYLLDTFWHGIYQNEEKPWNIFDTEYFFFRWWALNWPMLTSFKVPRIYYRHFLTRNISKWRKTMDYMGAKLAKETYGLPYQFLQNYLLITMLYIITQPMWKVK